MLKRSWRRWIWGGLGGYVALGAVWLMTENLIWLTLGLVVLFATLGFILVKLRCPACGQMLWDEVMSARAPEFHGYCRKCGTEIRLE